MMEAGAILRIIGKIQRFGLHDHHPNETQTNAEALLEKLPMLAREIKDLEFSMQAVEKDLRKPNPGAP